MASNGLFEWVKAVRNYYYIFKSVEPFRQRIVLADIALQTLKDRVKNKRKEINVLTKKCASYKAEYIKQEEQIKIFQKEIDECYSMKSKAARLLNALGGEKQKWNISKNLTLKKLEALEGDSLLAAAMVSYLAPFN